MQGNQGAVEVGGQARGRKQTLGYSGRCGSDNPDSEPFKDKLGQFPKITGGFMPGGKNLNECLELV